MSSPIPLLIGAVAGLCLLAMVWGYHLKTADQQVATGAVGTRRKKNKASQQTTAIAELADVLGRPLAPLVMQMLGPSGRTKIQRRIESAGRPGGMTVEGYARQKAGNIILFSGFGVLILLTGQIVLGVLLLAVGWFQTDITLRSKAKKRQEEIQRSLPDFLDVLAVTVSAGLAFRQALERVADAIPGPLSEEMVTAIRQMDLGTPRREAFEELRRRNDCEALSSFITAILQAEELGAPLSQALTEIAVDMRREFAQYARRRAQRAEPKITGVTASLALPGFLALLVGAMMYGLGGIDALG